MKPTKKAATIKDIAYSLGVSTATVSHALRPNPASNIKLPESTINRVREEAKKLNYRAHVGARSIRSRVFNNLGFFMAKRGKAHSPEGLIAGVHDAADKAGYRITHIRLPETVQNFEQFIPSVLTERNLDALLIGSYHPVSTIIHDKIQDDNLPVIYLNDKHLENAVYVDDAYGAYAMTRYLAYQGNRKICFVLRNTPRMPPLDEMHHSAADRIQGYHQAMREEGLEPIIRTILAEEVVASEHVYPDDWDEIVSSCDALFAYDDDLANEIGRWLYKKELRCPRDIRLAGYNGAYGSLAAWIELATVEIPHYEIGKSGFAMAMNLIANGNSQPEPSRKMKPKLRVGESACAC